MSTSSPSGAGEDRRFMPGGASEAESRAYAEMVGMGAEGPVLGESPAARAARLRRRRRLLLWGGVPALLVLCLSVWMGFVSVMTLLGNRAAINEDYPTAIERYQLVADVNPVIGKWRVHYNLGTARLLGEDLPHAVSELEEALKTAPLAEKVAVQDAQGSTVEILDPAAPECLVRLNLYVAHQGLAQKASEAGDTAGAQAETDAALSAAGECEIPPASQPQSDPSQSPSSEPTQPPSSQPSDEPSSQPSGEATSTGSPSGSPSADPSAQPSAGATPTAQPSGGASSSPSPSKSQEPTSSPSPVDPKQAELDKRNGEANGEGESGVSGNKRW